VPVGGPWCSRRGLVLSSDINLHPWEAHLFPLNSLPEKSRSPCTRVAWSVSSTDSRSFFCTMAIYKILVGSYTDSIHTLEFDTSDGTPKLKYLSSVNVGHHPSWIEGHPSDRSLIFTGLEQSDGKIVVVKYDEHGKGQKVDETTCSSGGADPCTLPKTSLSLET
jgi:hypothetical protein